MVTSGPSFITDSFGRRITYLRVSVTDRCNLRCVYCMPQEGIAWQPHEAILTYEEIAQVVAAAAQSGVTKVRLTGGEPLARRGLPGLVSLIAAIPGIDEISLTTNATLLTPALAIALAEAGLKRVNISLDTLQPERFERITRCGEIAKVWQGIAAAEAAGLAPVKLNCVVVRGMNADELVDFARLTLDHAWQVRFIELMPVGNEQSWGDDFPLLDERFIPVQEILASLNHLHIQPVNGLTGNGPARIYQIPGAPGTLGFISPQGEHFCGSCNRLRLTADGGLRPCLLHDLEIPLREAVRRGEDLLPYFRQAVGLKPEKHHLFQHETPTGRKMAQIGG